MLFCSNGPQHTSMADIAAEAGISKKTLYKHFENKEALVTIIYGRVIDHAERKLRLLLEKADNAVEEFLNITRLILSYHRFFSASVMQQLKAGYVEVFTEVNLFRQQFLPAVLSYNIERGIDSGLFKNDLDSNIVAHLTLTQLMAYKRDLGSLKQQYSDNIIQQHLMAQLLYGIIAPNGYSIAESRLAEKSSVSV